MVTAVLILLVLGNIALVLKLRKEIKEIENQLLIKINDLIINDRDFRNYADTLHAYALDNCDRIKKEYDNKIDSVETAIKRFLK